MLLHVRIGAHEQNADIREVRARSVDKQGPPASTLVGVQALVGADWLIEIDVVAVVPG